MRKLNLSVPFTLCALTLLNALCMQPAFAGANGSGGGSKLTGDFAAQAYRVVERIRGLNQSQVDPDVLKSTLDSPVKIEEVDTLIDPETGNPLKNQNLDAYGSKGWIQLRKGAPWGRYLASFAYDYLVAHELLRATGSYNDEGYRLSIGKLGLNKSYAAFSIFNPGVFYSGVCEYRIDMNQEDGLIVVEATQRSIYDCLHAGSVTQYRFKSIGGKDAQAIRGSEMLCELRDFEQKAVQFTVVSPDTALITYTIRGEKKYLNLRRAMNGN